MFNTLTFFFHSAPAYIVAQMALALAQLRFCFQSLDMFTVFLFCSNIIIIIYFIYKLFYVCMYLHVFTICVYVCVSMCVQMNCFCF